MDSVWYIHQKSTFQGFHSKDTSWMALGYVLELLGAASEPFLVAFGGSFGQPDGGTRRQNSVFCCHERRSTDFLPSEAFWGGFWVLFGRTFCCSELFLLQLFLLFGVGFLKVFQKAIVVVALCTSHTHLRHFAFQPNVSATSWVMISNVQICYSLKWVTCHTNMSVCVVMLLPGVSSHGGALK